MKPGDLVKLHPEEAVLMAPYEKERVGLVMGVDGRTTPDTLHILWAGSEEPEPEYCDGVVLVSEA